MLLKALHMRPALCCKRSGAKVGYVTFVLLRRQCYAKALPVRPVRRSLVYCVNLPTGGQQVHKRLLQACLNTRQYTKPSQRGQPQRCSKSSHHKRGQTGMSHSPSVYSLRGESRGCSTHSPGSRFRGCSTHSPGSRFRGCLLGNICLH